MGEKVGETLARFTAVIAGYRAGIHGDVTTDGRLCIDVEFPSMAHAAACAETMVRAEHDPALERLLPRPAVWADLPEPREVKSINDPVTLRFVINPLWIRVNDSE